MADQIKLVPVPGQMEKLLKSPEMVNHLAGLASEVARKAGPGFGSEAQVGRKKALAAVWPDTHEARVANARNHVLLRAIGRVS